LEEASDFEGLLACFAVRFPSFISEWGLGGDFKRLPNTLLNSAFLVGSGLLVMPPQPITRIQPDVTVDFDPVKLAGIPELTALPMTVIAIWATIDGILAKMLSHLIKSDLGTAVAMFHAIKSQDGQRQAILAAAGKTLASDDFKLFQAVLKASKASRDRRHDFAHHLWGLPSIPDTLALLDPRDSLRELAEFDERMREWRKQMRPWIERTAMRVHYHLQQNITPPAAPLPPDNSNVQCFRKQDLLDDVSDAEKALQLFLDLQRALFDQSQPAKDEARRRLLAEPQIQRALQPPSSETCGAPP